MVEEINIETENSQPEQNDMVEGFSLTGDILRTLEDKKVKIKDWAKRDFPDFKDPEKTRNKIVLSVELSNGATMDYIPNKTSLKTLMGKMGIMMGIWVGQEIELEVVKTKVSGEDKEVIYVKEN
jgi:hypothetical protein